MKNPKPIIVLATLAAIGLLAAEQSTVTVHEQGDDYAVTVPQSKLTLLIPKNGFELSTDRPAGWTPRYFLFHNTKAPIYVSGWFEQAKRYRGATNYWKELERSQPKSVPSPTDIQFSQEGKWDCIWYQVVHANGTQQNVHAGWIENGTWIDLHVSVFPYRPKDKNLILAFLNASRPEPKH